MRRLHRATYAAFRLLTEHYPPPHPVKLQGNADLFATHDAWGMTTPLFGAKHGKRFRIELEPQRSHALELEVLCHEYAHVLSWPTIGGAHSAIWGVHYAMLYAELIDP